MRSRPGELIALGPAWTVSGRRHRAGRSGGRAMSEVATGGRIAIHGGTEAHAHPQGGDPAPA